MTFKIAVCAGHGKNTSGKRTPDNEREWTFNDKVVRAFISEMSKYKDVEVKRFDDPTGNTDVSLQKRTDGANAWGANIYISFHHNANTGKWGSWGGTETFTYGKGDSLRLGKLVHSKLIKSYGLRDRGLKTANLHIINETKMPAVLLEGGFMDSITDIKKLRDNKVLVNAGVAVAQGVVEYGGLKKKPVAPKPIVKPKPPVKAPVKLPVSNTTYRVQVGAFKDRENAEKLVKELKAKGISASINI